MIPFAVTVTILTTTFVASIIVFLIVVKSRQNKKARAYLQAVIDEKERTMQLISMEVHDNVAQMLSLARMKAHILSDEVGLAQAEDVRQLGEILEKLIVDTQDISHTLNPQYFMSKGLLASLEEEVRRVNTKSGTNGTLTLKGGYRRMKNQTELMLYRIAQEAIHNALKHADAKEIEIVLDYGERLFEMAISDNGKGFDIGSEHYKNGVGMLSMRERARVASGEVKVLSELGKGTTVRVVIYE